MSEPEPSAEEHVTPPKVETSKGTVELGFYRLGYVPRFRAVVETSKGTIKLELFSDVAPNHVASFVELSQAGFFDGIKFHRVVPGFAVQVGDPQTRDYSGEEVAETVRRHEKLRAEFKPIPPGDVVFGTGGPGYSLAQEFNSRQHLEGTLAMARSQSPDSGGSQFYICLAPQPSLDGQYTVFGQVIEGMDVVEKIAVGDEILSLSIENATE